MTISPSTTDIPNRQQFITAAPWGSANKTQVMSLTGVMGGNALKPGDFVYRVVILISAVERCAVGQAGGMRLPAPLLGQGP